MDIQLLMDLGMDGTTKLGFGAIGWRVLPTPNHVNGANTHSGQAALDPSPPVYNSSV
jgi:hypothetical protein